MVSEDPAFTVIIVAYNAGRYLTDCLEALGRQSFTDFEVLLVDNGSDDGSVEALDTLDPRVRILHPGTNLGFAAGNNLAARSAQGRWLALLNPDAMPAPDWLERIDAATQRYPGVAMFGSTQLQADCPDLLDGAGDHFHPLGLAWRGGAGDPAETVTTDAEVFGPCGAAAIYRRDAFEQAGGFEERFFCYYEDVDLALRLRLMGETCVQLAWARVGHVGSTTTGSGSDFIRYHVTRNRIWTFLRGLPGPLLVPLLPGLVVTIMLRLVFGIGSGDLGVRTQAVRDALIKLPEVLRERRAIQARRRINSLALARMMTWSIGKLLLRARDARPLSVDMARPSDTTDKERGDGGH